MVPGGCNRHAGAARPGVSRCKWFIFRALEQFRAGMSQGGAHTAVYTSVNSVNTRASPDREHGFGFGVGRRPGRALKSPRPESVVLNNTGAIPPKNGTPPPRTLFDRNASPSAARQTA